MLFNGMIPPNKKAEQYLGATPKDEGCGGNPEGAGLHQILHGLKYWLLCISSLIKPLLAYDSSEPPLS